jgi:hypothetical protein
MHQPSNLPPGVTDHERVQERPYDVVGAIIEFEEGNMDWEHTIEFSQYLVDTGLAWTLQGSYGRSATRLIELGLITAEVTS